MRKKHEKIIQNISLLIEQSEFEKAAKYYDDTTLGEDTPADLFFLLAIVLNGVKRNDESLELYSRALRKTLISGKLFIIEEHYYCSIVSLKPQLVI